MEKMEMKRIRRTSSDTMDDIESSSDLTRRDIELQYLGNASSDIGPAWPAAGRPTPPVC
jgi:hypothetical protein